MTLPARGSAMGQFALFAVAGTLGFMVDAAIVQLLVSAAGWNPYLARLLSFLVAVLVTWLFNRTYTFAGVRRHDAMGEWLRYLVAMSGGFAVNYGLYSLLVFGHELVQAWPVLGVAAGSLAGMLCNFATARWWIYRE